MSDVIVTAASVVAANSNTVIARGTAGATVTAGQAVWADPSASYQVKPAVATNVTQATSTVGIALNGAAVGQPIAYATAGDVTFNNAFVAATVYVLSGANAGGIAPSADLDSSSNTNYGTVLGISTSATNLRVGLISSGVFEPLIENCLVLTLRRNVAKTANLPHSCFKICLNNHQKEVKVLNQYEAFKAVDLPVNESRGNLKLFRSKNVTPPHISYESAYSCESPITQPSSLVGDLNLNTVLRAASMAEYDANWSAGHYKADNDLHKVQIVFTPEQMRVVDSITQHVWQVKLSRYGYDHALLPVLPAQLNVLGSRVEYQRGPLTEWYINGPMGLEQGFTLFSPPELMAQGEHYLVLEMDLSGDLIPVLAHDGCSLDLKSEDDLTVFSYGHLSVEDAEKRSLPACFELLDNNDGAPSCLRIVVDDRDAAYPIVIDPLVERFFKLFATDGAANDAFGYSVAINGTTAIFGAPQASGITANSGKAYVFVLNNNKWVFQATLMASDGVSGDMFGNSVSFDPVTQTVIVGAPNVMNNGNTHAGAAYVFVYNGTTWSQQIKLTASDGLAYDYFGTAVLISGDTAIIGAVGVPGADLHLGAVYFFTRVGTTWTSHPRLMPADQSNGDNDFGYALAIDGNTLVIGARGFDHGGVSNGSVYVYVGSGASWSQQAELLVSEPVPGTNFGASVALSGNTLVAGAPYAIPTIPGAAYVFTRSGTHLDTTS